MSSKKKSRRGEASAVPSRILAQAHAFSASDYDMLRAAKRLVDETVDVFGVAETDLLVVVDATDHVGAQLLRAHFQARGMGTTETAAMIKMWVQPPGGRPLGRHPLVALWASKLLVLPLLVDLGFEVPSD